MLNVGPCKATILRSSLRTVNDKVVVALSCITDYEEPCEVLIYLTERSMGIARAQLRTCGFDVDLYDLERLDDNPSPIATHVVPLFVEEFGGKLRAQIEIPRKPPKGLVRQLQVGLRAAKQNGEGVTQSTLPSAPSQAAVTQPAPSHTTMKEMQDQMVYAEQQGEKADDLPF